MLQFLSGISTTRYCMLGHINKNPSILLLRGFLLIDSKLIRTLSSNYTGRTRLVASINICSNFDYNHE